MSSSTPRGSKRPRTVLSPELLEDRTNPAGNVTVIQEGGVLHIWGDSQDNRIWIAGAGNDTVIITPLDGTRLNGVRTQLWYTGIKFAYDVRLHGGRDFLYASGLTGKAGLFVDSGTDNDGVALEHLKIDGAVINTGTGNDTVHVGGGKLNWMSFNLGIGDDRMNVYGTEFGGVAFNGGTGHDTLAVMAVEWNEFPLTTAFEAVFGSLMPVANNDRARVGHGESVTINVLANDRAIIGILDPSSIRITRQPEHGTLRVNDNGTITYTSDDGSTAPRDSFRYTVRTSTEFARMQGAYTAAVTGPALRRFVEQGGTLIGVGTASMNLAQFFGLPVSNHLTERSPDGTTRPLPAEKFYIPGSVLRAAVDPTIPASHGLRSEADVFFDNSPVFALAPDAALKGVRPIAWFDSSRPLRSGWAYGQGYLEGGVAALEARVGSGHLFLFGPEITFRAQPAGTFKFLFNAIYLGAPGTGHRPAADRSR